ncbi:MAG: hypothetical protein NVS9B10_07090 [Nevskia sp.]
MTSDSIPPALIAATETDEFAASRGSPGGPGRAIRAARERARLSIEELAIQTKLARSALEALERDDFDALNEPVYVRGYYRKCAKVLALSETDLISSYEKLVVPKAPQAPTKLLIGSGPAMGRPSLRRRGNGGRVVAVIVVAAAISALVWFLLNQPGVFAVLHGAAPASAVVAPVAAPAPGSASRSASELSSPTPVAAPAKGESAAESAATHASAAGIEQSAPAPAAGTAPTTAASPSPAASVATTAAATDSALAASGDLTLSFKSTSWVRVEDADGRLLMSGVIQGGDRQQVRGHAPYSLFVGNAPAVVVEYDGKVVDTAPFVKSNSTARLTVP